MVEIPAQQIPAKVLPVASGVNEMEVPCLIHCGGRTDGMTGEHCQGDEALVFGDHLAGKRVGPSLLAGQPAGERQLCLGIVQLESRDPFQQS